MLNKQFWLAVQRTAVVQRGHDGAPQGRRTGRQAATHQRQAGIIRTRICHVLGKQVRLRRVAETYKPVVLPLRRPYGRNAPRRVIGVCAQTAALGRCASQAKRPSLLPDAYGLPLATRATGTRLVVSGNFLSTAAQVTPPVAFLRLPKTADVPFHEPVSGSAVEAVCRVSQWSKQKAPSGASWVRPPYYAICQPGRRPPSTSERCESPTRKRAASTRKAASALSA